MSVNENTDDPSSTASARVHSTCSVIAVAPETAKAISAARRERASSTGGGGSAVPSRWASAAATSSRSSTLVLVDAPRRGGSRRASTIAAASVRLNDAAVTFVQRSAERGQEHEAREERRPRPRRTG